MSQRPFSSSGSRLFQTFTSSTHSFDFVQFLTPFVVVLFRQSPLWCVVRPTIFSSLNPCLLLRSVRVTGPHPITCRSPDLHFTVSVVPLVSLRVPIVRVRDLRSWTLVPRTTLPSNLGTEHPLHSMGLDVSIPLILVHETPATLLTCHYTGIRRSETGVFDRGPPGVRDRWRDKGLKDERSTEQVGTDMA